MNSEKILSICNDILLTNYWCTRRNMSNITPDYIVGLDEINQWSEFFKRVDYSDINRSGNGRSHSKTQFTIHNIEVFLENAVKPIYDILNIGKGKISLCGGAVISLLGGKYPKDFDLFFHSGTVDEIDEIFNECLEYLRALEERRSIYRRSQYVMDVLIPSISANIQFIKRVYQTKEQVLFGFDLAASRLGYNPKDGLFATICGAMAFSMNAFVFDGSNRSRSSSHRLHKYTENKGYAVLFPQLQTDLIKDDQESFKIFDNIEMIKHYAIDNQFFIHEGDSGNDYACDGDNLKYIINKDYENVAFVSENFDQIIELPDEFIEKQMIENNSKLSIPISRQNVTKESAKEFFGEAYKKFALAYFVDENIEKADNLWKEKCQEYITIAKNIAQSMSSTGYFTQDNIPYHKGWKYLNPGSRRFGQNYPVTGCPTEYYKPLEIGISTARFQAFMDCRKNIEYLANLPKEIFNLICEYWLKYEVEDARARLLNLKKVKKPAKKSVKSEEIRIKKPRHSKKIALKEID